jgi:hypothetical protein
MFRRHTGDDEAGDGQAENQRYRRDLPPAHKPLLHSPILLVRNGRGKAGLG